MPTAAAGSRDRPIALWMLHALGGSARQWDEAASSRTLTAYEVVAPDLPGAGGVQSRRDLTLDQLAREMAPRIAASPKPVVLVGHSLGGVLATLIAELRPEQLIGFVNVEGNLTISDCTGSAAAVGATDFAAWLDQFARECESGSEPLRRYAGWLRRWDPATFLAYSRELVRLSTDSAIGQRYSDLSLPRFYLRGDRSFPGETSTFIKDHRLRERVVPDASHIVVWERPEDFNAALGECLAQIA